VRAVLPPGFNHTGRRRSVVLIDEIDKAPRDFPNDILNEIERLYFRIPELGEAEIVAAADFRPVVIITSNSEKALPDAFLRRCIFYSIPFPDDLRLEQIILSRLGARVQPGAEMLRDAIAFFVSLRKRDMLLRKRPGTAELLNWIAALIEFDCDPKQPIRPQAEAAQRTLYTLAKMTEDQEQILKAFTVWVHSAG
jgi:MoxR-like ATPase